MVRLMSPCWLVRALPPYCQIILIGTSSWSLPRTPSRVAVISAPRSTASVQVATEMEVSTGFSYCVLKGAARGRLADASRPPVPPPGMPGCPSRQARVNTARAWFSPLAWRCGPQPWVMATGFAPAISRASWRMRVAGTPVTPAAHSGVFAVLSGPRPSM